MHNCIGLALNELKLFGSVRTVLTLSVFVLMGCGAQKTLQELTDSLKPEEAEVPQLPKISVLSQSSIPHHSKFDNFTFTASCVAEAQVFISGADNTEILCPAGGSFSYSLDRNTDGSFTLQLIQKKEAFKDSEPLEITWVRDTIAPSPPVIANPTGGAVTTNTNSVVLSGTCESESTVHLTGAATLSTPCIFGGFSFTVTQSSDGIFTYSSHQVDRAGNISNNSPAFVWTRDTVASSAPAITSPTTQPYISNESSFNLSGTCEPSAQVFLSGEQSGTVTCSGGGSFTILINKATGGDYQYSLRQQDLAGNFSASILFRWIKDPTAPAVPVIVLPVGSQHYSSLSNLSMRVQCDSNKGAVVHLAGDILAAEVLTPAGQLSQTCSSSPIEFLVQKNTDGAYNFQFTQTDPTTNLTSAPASMTWNRDTQAPSILSLSQPASSPVTTSGQDNLLVSGSCEAFATVLISGDHVGEAPCSETNTFSITINKVQAGTYSFSLRQRDRAQNLSNSISLVWQKDPAGPTAPIFTLPTVSPFYSNQDQLTLRLTCTASHNVVLSGDILAADVISPAGQLSQVCNTSPVEFTVQKTSDGTYSFQAKQVDSITALESPTATQVWIRDTVAPNAISLTTPNQNPYDSDGDLTLAGTCEDQAVVHVLGDANLTQTCSSSNFSFLIEGLPNGSYQFDLHQTDLAGNSSGVLSQVWNKASGALPSPTIAIPSAATTLSNLNLFTLSGACVNGYDVVLGGDVLTSEVSSPTNQLSQACTGSTYSFTISKSTDGTFQFDVKHVFGMQESGVVSRTWTRDTAPPSVTIASGPSNPSPSATASFVFSADESPSTFECSLDAAAYTSCSSPLNLNPVANGSRVLYIRATDQAGNTGTASTWSWSQAGWLTVALYRLDSASPTTDSGSFTQVSGFNNNLVANGSPANDTTGKYPTASPTSRSFGTDNFYSVTHNNSLGTLTQTMTIEGFFKITANLTQNQYYTLVSKTTNSSPNFGWELRLLKPVTNPSHRYFLSFVGSLNGTSEGTVVNSSQLQVNTNTWYYFAVTWDRGSVAFYFGATAADAFGTGSIGTVGSAALHQTTAPLRLGANASSGSGNSRWLAGSLDEIRISQTLRTITFPTGPQTPD